MLELLTRLCQRQLDSRHRVVVYDDSTSTLCPPADNSLVDVLVSRLADSCITTALLDGNDLQSALYGEPVYPVSTFCDIAGC